MNRNETMNIVREIDALMRHPVLYMWMQVYTAARQAKELLAKTIEAMGKESEEDRGTMEEIDKIIVHAREKLLEHDTGKEMVEAMERTETKEEEEHEHA